MKKSDTKEVAAYLIHGKRRFSYLNEDISTSPFSFFLTLSHPLKSELEDIHFGSITSVVNYFQRTRQAEIKTLSSLTNTSKCLYFITSTMVLSAHLKNLFQVFLRLSKGTSWKRYIIGMTPNNSL